LTFSVGGSDYVNIRERPESMTCTGYEHFGVLLSSAEEADRLWADLEAEGSEVHLTPMNTGKDGSRSFRFRHLLPFAVEVQWLPGLNVAKRSAPGAMG
jgi:hypothetical protein